MTSWFFGRHSEKGTLNTGQHGYKCRIEVEETRRMNRQFGSPGIGYSLPADNAIPPPVCGLCGGSRP